MIGTNVIRSILHRCCSRVIAPPGIFFLGVLMACNLIANETGDAAEPDDWRKLYQWLFRHRRRPQADR